MNIRYITGFAQNFSFLKKSLVILRLQLFKHKYVIFNSSFAILLYIFKSFSEIIIMSFIDTHLFYKNTLPFGELRFCYEINYFKRMCSLKVEYTHCPPAITKDSLSFVRSIFVKSKSEPLLPTLREICEGLRCYSFLDQIIFNLRFFLMCFAQVRCFHGPTIFF